MDAILDIDGFDRLLALLREQGYEVIGPVRADGVIGLGPVATTSDLPAGVRDRQSPGRYRLERRADPARFGWASGPHSWKRYLHPPTVTLWSGRRADGGFVADPPSPPPRFAFVGVRPCDIAAIAVQDRVFLGGPTTDATYGGRRRSAFVVAVNCTAPAGTCFCASMGSGPAATDGFDLALTEVVDDGGSRFVVSVGSETGGEVLAGVTTVPASPDDVAAARAALDAARRHMGRELETSGLPELLSRNLDHPLWDDVARRCLTCGNCTMVCPTCFCTTMVDEIDLDGAAARRVRRWDSCFGAEFTYLHGGPVRSSPAARYRQWLTHKLGTWVAQFGTSGCVGCGRCITWCPVGIDLTAEIESIRTTEEVARVRARPTP